MSKMKWEWWKEEKVEEIDNNCNVSGFYKFSLAISCICFGAWQQKPLMGVWVLMAVTHFWFLSLGVLWVYGRTRNPNISFSGTVAGSWYMMLTNLS